MQICFTQKWPLNSSALLLKIVTIKVTILESMGYRYTTVQQWNTTPQKHTQCQKDMLSTLCLTHSPLLDIFFSPETLLKRWA